ncbi:CAP domain-containing protein [Pseudalkalibacillus sp. SCS-8]|uniref:CAP domain-containing protein n=1 Tax=Pseudalkalibacillus nanhaiensis TaxID=3115291 RepID=UPI0032DB1291
MKKQIVTLSLTALMSIGVLAGCNTENNNTEEGMQLQTVDYNRNNNDDLRTRLNNDRFRPIWYGGQERYRLEIPFSGEMRGNGPQYRGQYGGGMPADRGNNQQAAPQQGDRQQQNLPNGDGQTISQVEREVIDLTNQERAKKGLPKLKAHTKLSQVAQAKSDDMLENGYFSHNSPNYGSPFQMMQEFGVSYQSAAENIAAGQRSAEQVVKDWMNSPGHRRNIMNGELTHIGVGYSTGGNQGSYWTQMFIEK